MNINIKIKGKIIKLRPEDEFEINFWDIGWGMSFDKDYVKKFMQIDDFRLLNKFFDLAERYQTNKDD